MVGRLAVLGWGLMVCEPLGAAAQAPGGAPAQPAPVTVPAAPSSAPVQPAPAPAPTEPPSPAAQPLPAEAPTAQPAVEEPSTETPATPPPSPQARELGGHLFTMPTRLVPSFVTSYFSFRQGASLATVNLGQLEDSGTAESVRVAGLVEKLRVGVRVLPWFGLFAAAEGQLVSALNADDIVLQGVNFDGGYTFGASFEAFRREAWGTQIGVHIRYQGRIGREILPSRAEAVIEEVEAGGAPDAPAGDVEDQALRDSVNDYVGELFDTLQKELWAKRKARTGDLVLTAAQRLHRNVGLSLNLEARLGGVSYETLGREDATHAHARRSVVAAASQLSANTLPYAPLAFSLEYRYQRTFDDFDRDVANLQRSRQSFGGGIYYAGRRELMLGLFTTYRLGRLAGQSRDTFFLELVFDYMFR